MTDDRRSKDNPAEEPTGGRNGDSGKLGGASKRGHLSPQIDDRDGTVRKGGQIAQSSQQASGQGTGQS